MTSIRYPHRLLAASLMTPLLIATAACAGDKAATTDSAAMAMADSAGASASAMGAPASAGAMDAPVAQFLATVNRGEMSSGELAISKATNAEVKAFAQQMVTEHQTAMQALQTMASASGWTIDSAAMASGMGGMSDSAHAAMMAGGSAAASPGSTPQSGAAALTTAMQQMQQMMATSMQQLRSQSGAAFDRAYMDAQLAGHQQTLDLLRQYNTSVQSNELRSHVTQVQGSVEQHLQKAKDIRGKLGG